MGSVTISAPASRPVRTGTYSGAAAQFMLSAALLSVLRYAWPEVLPDQWTTALMLITVLVLDFMLTRTQLAEGARRAPVFIETALRILTAAGAVFSIMVLNLIIG